MRPLIRRGIAAVAVATTLLALSPASAHADNADNADDADPRSGPTTEPDDGEVIATASVDELEARSLRIRQETTAGGAKVYPVPTSSATLRRITTAPNGDMWFVERDSNKIGRIKPNGAITEFTLPAQTTADSWVVDLDVAPNGKVWVSWDQGWKISRIDVATVSAYTWTFDYPYAEEIRVGPGGVAWATVSYDEDGIVRIEGDNAVWHDNAPECDGSLGRGTDGRMWCQQFAKLIRVEPAGNGGVSYPLPSNATYPYSIAPGPTGDIWFARDDGGTMFTSPGDGNVGWVTASSGAVRVIRIGSATAPRSLVKGPDGSMWFTSVGRSKGIGHISSSGVGAVTKVGNYAPTSLTFAKDGSAWFTDATNNVIVKVPRSNLRYTNLDLGSGSQLKAPKATRKVSLAVRKAGAKRTFKGAVSSAAPACRRATVVLLRAKGRKGVKVATTRSKSNGAFVIAKRRVPKGKYYVAVRATRSLSANCGAATSSKRGG